MGSTSNARVQKIGHFKELSNHRELGLEVNSPYTNTPPPQVMHKEPIE